MEDLITLKGFRSGVTLILNDTEPDFQKILNQLKAKLESTNFFKNTAVNVDIGRRESLTCEQLASLKEVLSRRDIQLKNVILNGYKSRRRVPRAQKAKGIPTIGGNNLLLNRTIRSGQRLYYPGSIILMGDVHPGGEIVAGNHIIVWGALKGVAHAGSTGDERSFIIALQLTPVQLRIAHYIACSPEPSPSLPGRTEIAYVLDRRIVIEEYEPGRNLLALTT